MTNDPGAAAPPDERAMLLAFLRDRSVPCPACGYDLRNLAVGRCPECRTPLRLAVAAPPPPIARLVFAVAPGIFSGICAGILAVIITITTAAGNGPPLGPWLLFGFGLASGLGALALLLTARRRFFTWSPTVQRGLALGLWIVHVAVFLYMLPKM